ncbi:expressed protein, partial [Dictyostelium purpureum]
PNFTTKETTIKIQVPGGGEGKAKIESLETEPETRVFQNSDEFSCIYYGSLLTISNIGNTPLIVTSNCN